jgi:hypothetical protein
MKSLSWTVRCGVGRSDGITGFADSEVGGWRRVRRGFLPALGLGKLRIHPSQSLGKASYIDVVFGWKQYLSNTVRPETGVTTYTL